MLRQIGQNRANIVVMTTMLDPVFVRSPDASEVIQSQHERTVRLARLSMLIECEGHITIGMAPPTITRNRPSLYPTVGMANTADAIIEEARDTLISEGIGFSLHATRYSSGFNGTRERRDIHMHGFTRVGSVLAAMFPFLRSKKKQGEIVLEFIRSRQSANLKDAYSDYEWQLATEVRKLNGCRPQTRALAKAKAYLESSSDPNRARTAEYFRKYVEMCTELQSELARKGS